MQRSILRIPEFQRDYAWGEDEVQSFWNDLSGALQKDSYFLGLLILTEEDSVSHVVDGQQRLLTLLLLAQILHNNCIQYGRHALAERVSSTFLYAIDYSSDQKIPRISASSVHDAEILRHVFASGDVPWPDSAKAGLLARAYRQLNGAFSRDLAGSEAFKRLSEWAVFLNERLYFTVFTHPDRSAAYKVYEVVNTRGKELTTADLIKSYILGEAREPDRSDIYNRWQAIFERFRAADRSSQFVQFLRHVLVVRLGPIEARDLYDRVAARYKGPSGIQMFLEEIESELDLYLQMMDPKLSGPASDDELAVFSAIATLDIRTVRPLLLALHRSDDASSGLRNLLELIVRRIVVGNLGTGNVERRFGLAARDIAKDPEKSWRSAMNVLEDLSPTREDFVAKVANRSFNQNVLFFLRSSILQSTKTPKLEGSLYAIRPRSGNGWNYFDDEVFRRFGSTLVNTIIATTDRRPKGSNSPVGFQSLLLPYAAKEEFESALGVGQLVQELGEPGGWDDNKLVSISSQLASAASLIWYE